MNNIENILEKIREKTSVSGLMPLYEGKYYLQDQIRGRIYRCDYQGRPAILKILDDPRLMLEVSAHRQFLEKNQNPIIKAPEIFQAEQLSPGIAWILMEKIPDGQIFDRAYIDSHRKEFIKLYLEYRQTFPQSPSRPLALSESLPANDFHVMRLSRWADLATTAEYASILQNQPRLLDPDHFAKLFSESLRVISRTFAGRPMVWSKGNFWPKHLVRATDGKYWIFDFSLTKMYPEGYELGGIAWSCFLMGDYYNLPLTEWLTKVADWQKAVLSVARKLGYKNPTRLIRSCLLERTWGTILADVLTSDKPAEQKAKMLEYLIQLVEQLLK